MNNDLDIFICTHKDFVNCPDNSIYKICCSVDVLKNKYPIEVICEQENKYTPIRESMSNMSRLYYIWKNYPLKKYVGFVQYRRHFDYNIVNDELNVDDDTCIVSSSIKCNVPHQFKISHNDKDYVSAKEIIKNKFNISEDDIIKTESKLYAHNIFIMSTKKFNDYCNFMFTILDEFININNLKTMNDINKKYPGTQNRILGYLAERIGNIHIQYNFSNIIEKNLIIN